MAKTKLDTLVIGFVQLLFDYVRHVRCGYCGNEWMEVVTPEGIEENWCACNKGKSWKPEDGMKGAW